MPDFQNYDIVQALDFVPTATSDDTAKEIAQAKHDTATPYRSKASLLMEKVLLQIESHSL